MNDALRHPLDGILQTANELADILTVADAADRHLSPSDLAQLRSELARIESDLGTVAELAANAFDPLAE